jgi:hypothetical protein
MIEKQDNCCDKEFTIVGVCLVVCCCIALIGMIIYKHDAMKLEMIKQIDSVEYRIKQIDSINYNIIKRDSIIYREKLRYIDDVNKAKTLNDSASIELFYSLVNEY